MQSIGVRELKQNASAVLARVREGESFVVTDRGLPIAQITPLASGSLTALRNAGLVRRRTIDVSSLPPPLRRDPSSKPTLSELVQVDREDRV
jgi:prevent-host-death family protein